MNLWKQNHLFWFYRDCYYLQIIVTVWIHNLKFLIEESNLGSRVFVQFSQENTKRIPRAIVKILFIKACTA